MKRYIEEFASDIIQSRRHLLKKYDKTYTQTTKDRLYKNIDDAKNILFYTEKSMLTDWEAMQQLTKIVSSSPAFPL